MMSRRRGSERACQTQTLVHIELPESEKTPSCMFVLNLSTGTLSLLGLRHIGPMLLLQERFTRQEVSVLLPLLMEYPFHCPYAVLLASFQKTGCGSLTEEEIDLCRVALLDAQEEGSWDQFLRPMRCVISRVRLKVRELGLEIVSLEEKGYLFRRRETPMVTDFSFPALEQVSVTQDGAG